MRHGSNLRRNNSGIRLLAGGALLLTLGVTVPASAASVVPTSSSLLYSWGLGLGGGVGNGGTTDVATPVSISLPGGVQPLTLAENSGVGARGMVIGTNHLLYGWGGNTVGQLGNGTTSQTPVLSPTAVTMPRGVTASHVAVGDAFTLMIGSDNQLYAWGDNTMGELGQDPAPKNGSPLPSSSVPLHVHLPSGVIPASIAAGLDEAALIDTTGRLFTWGDNQSGELGLGLDTVSSPFVFTPTQVSFGNSTIAQVAIGQSFMAARTSAGLVYTWGAGSLGQLGNGTIQVGSQGTPLAMAMPQSVTATQISASTYNGAFLGSNGLVYVWGTGNQGTLAGTSATLGCGIFNCTTGGVAIATLPTGVTATSVSVGERQVMIAGSDGHLYAWGNNSDFELGTGNTTDLSVATPTAVILPAGLQATAQLLNYENGLAIVRAVLPLFTSTNKVTSTVGRPCSLLVHSAGSPAPVLSTIGSLPSGMMLTDNGGGSGTLACTSSRGEGGVHLFSLHAASDYGEATQPFTLTVNEPPAITSSTTVAVRPTVRFTVPVIASGYPAPRLTASNLPRGVTFSANTHGGTFSGLPTALGTTMLLHVTATNGVAPNATGTIHVVVATPPVITSRSSATIKVGSYVQIPLTATGSPLPTFGQSSDLQALGMQVVVGRGGMASITGFAQAGSGGVHTITLVATNGFSTSQKLRLTINEAPSISGPPAALLSQGFSTLLHFSATGFPSVTKMSISGNLDGLSFTDMGDGTATISGMPTNLGSFGLRISATNAAGTTTESFNMMVESNQT